MIGADTQLPAPSPCNMVWFICFLSTHVAFVTQVSELLRAVSNWQRKCASVETEAYLNCQLMIGCHNTHK